MSERGGLNVRNEGGPYIRKANRETRNLRETKDKGR